MIDLIETLIGAFITVSIFYAGHFYGARVMLELVIVIIVVCMLVFFLIAETMKSVSQEILEDEETAEKEDDRNVTFGTVKKLAAFYTLLFFTNAFSKIYDRCSEILKDNEEGGDLYE